jgi:hypothetical protein
MSCPSESRTLDEYSSAAPRYDSPKKSGLRKKLKEIGIKVYEAVGIVPKNSIKKYTLSFEIEKIIGESVSSELFSSAWGSSYKCDCQGVSISEYSVTYHAHDIVMRSCRCDTVVCNFHQYCSCDEKEMTCYVGCRGD